MTNEQKSQINNFKALGFNSKESKILSKAFIFYPTTGSISEQEFLLNRMITQNAIEMYQCSCELLGKVIVRDDVAYKINIKDTAKKFSDILSYSYLYVVKDNNNVIHFLKFIFSQNEYRLIDEKNSFYVYIKKYLK